MTVRLAAAASVWTVVSDADTPGQPGPDQRGERGLAQPAQRQRGQRDAELAGRKVGGELRGDAEQQAGAELPFAGELLEPGRPDLDERELRSDEERVRQDHHAGEEQGDGRMHGVRRIAQFSPGPPATRTLKPTLRNGPGLL